MATKSVSGHNFQKQLQRCHADVPTTVKALKKKKKICWCHYFFLASSPGLPSPPPPQHPWRHDLRAAPGSMQGKHVLTAMQTLSRSEPAKADSALAGGVDQSCREGCRGASSRGTRVAREGSPQCTRTIKPNAQLPQPLISAPRIRWEVRRRR